MPINSFPLPQSNILVPKISLLRYMPIWKFADLVSGRAWFSSIAQFRDPQNDLLEADPMNLFVHSPAHTVGNLDVQQLLPEAIKHASDGDRRMLEKFKAENINCTSTLFGLFHEYIYQARAAWCWYGTERESALMWKVFAKDGIAIQTSLEALLECLPAAQTFELGAIRYHTIRQAQQTSYNFEKDPKMLARPYFLKCDGFQDEHEVRVVTNCPIGEEGIGVCIGGVDKLIQKIIVSPYVEGGWRGHDCKRSEVELIWSKRFGSNSTAPIVSSLLKENWLDRERRRDKLRERVSKADAE